MTLTKTLLIPTLLLLAQAAPAATTEGEYAMRGLGAARCGALSEALAAEGGAALRDTLGAWISGYVSGRNEAQADTYDTVPLQDTRILTALLAAACQANPEALLQVTLSAVVQKLDGARVRTPGAPLQIGEPPIAIQSEVLAFVQARLVAKRLLEQVAVPGTWDAATGVALADFQGSVGLPASGLPDDATILMLMGQE